ncbi:polyprenyl synthetase family protein [Actinomyces sp. MRS3W]|uniref:polyprenyl synthetase family protein n=1 Tax=Actinomyces sp. MRS3W TaxID=2800796 RepID=UPI0028FD7AFB|nr:polyprenyl synthetase family protein [Actinomyces sp. MRS3W]MDU0349192.1 polyprenyl synthetase family protein [Actinomyces sp. MRS3W]
MTNVTTDVDVLLPLVRGVVDARLERVVAQLREHWHASAPASDELLDAADALLTGGKRMRAVLGAVGLALPGQSSARAEVLGGPIAARLGAALELYQASALVHDDIIDAADTRRGRPAAHRRYAARHRQAGWQGAADSFGVNAAILLGDLLMSAASAQMGAAASRCDRAAAAAAREAFDAMTAEVAVGQFLDVHQEVLALPSPSQSPVDAGTAMRIAALEVVRHKSARYSVMYPLLIGALLAGAQPGSALLTALEVFGEEIGVAFQLRDDVLGVFGDPQVTGKPAGDDLREGKRTVLVALTWQRCNDAGRALLTRVLSGQASGEKDIAAAAAVIRDCGALAAHEEEIAAHTAAGLAALDALPEEPHAASRPIDASSQSARALLADLATVLTARQT